MQVEAKEEGNDESEALTEQGYTTPEEEEEDFEAPVLHSLQYFYLSCEGRPPMTMPEQRLNLIFTRRRSRMRSVHLRPGHLQVVKGLI